MAFLKLDCLDAFYGGPLTLDSKVLTPYGFRLMKDVGIGDEVITPSGKASKIIDIPFEGFEDTYRITFSDGTFVDASEGHKWLVSTGDWNKTQSKWREKRTLELLQNYKLPRNRFRYKIPLVSKNINFSDKQHIISPYILGILIGDGSITKSNPIKITNTKKEIYNEILKELIDGYHLTAMIGKLKNNYNISQPGYGYNNSPNLYALELKRMGLLGKTAEFKFIPNEYLYDSRKNRLRLLKGLMDTDGDVRLRKKYSEYRYSTISERLKNDIIFLVQSLGGLATSTKENDYCYRIYIRIDEDICNVKSNFQSGKNIVRMITDIKHIGKRQVRCITIDNPEHLFVTNDFIVTKNSAGGGKSDALLMAALQYVDSANYNAILIRDTFKNLSEPGALMDRADEWLSNTDAKWNGENRCWKFPSGATLGFGYLDGPKDHYNHQGAEYQFVGIDEIVNIRENQAKYMFSRLRKLEGVDIPIRFRCASNPPEREQLERGAWVKRKYVDPVTRHNDVIFVPAKLPDNPYLNKEEYVKSLNKLDPVTRKQLLDGDWNIRVKGNMFDRSWFEIVDAIPQDVIARVRFWDRAATEEAKTGKQPAFTCGAKWSKTKSKIYYIESIVRFRKTPLGNKQTIRQVADTDGRSVIVGIEQEPGSSGKDVIDDYRRNVLPDFTMKEIPARGRGTKLQWAGPWLTQAEAGNIKVVKGAWNEAFFDEGELFPDGEFKDQIDGCSGAYSMLQKGSGIRVTDV